VYITHHFDRNQTLARACYWLTHCGFESSRLEVHPGPRPRLAVIVDGVGQAVVAQQIFDVLDTAPDDGCPVPFDLSKLRPAAPKADPAPGRTAIGWNPHALDLPADPPRAD
jgi:hypothetical protein